MDSLWIFIFGCVGALAPEITRLYNLRTKTKFTWSPFYILISTLFALLGGIIAWILPSTSYHGAFYAGVAAPVIVTTIKRNSDSKSFEAENQDDAAPQAELTIGEALRNYWKAL